MSFTFITAARIVLTRKGFDARAAGRSRSAAQPAGVVPGTVVSVTLPLTTEP